MSQSITELTPADTTFLDQQRWWVAGFLAEDSGASFAELSVKLQVLQAIIDNGWVARNETAKLQALGVVFGDMLAELLSVPWVMVEDEFGRDPALLITDDPVLVFPVTMISKRIEDDETVDVAALLTIAAESAMGYIDPDTEGIDEG